VIANEFNEVSSDLYLSALVEAGLILFVLTSWVNIARVLCTAAQNRLHSTVASAQGKKKVPAWQRRRVWHRNTRMNASQTINNSRAKLAPSRDVYLHRPPKCETYSRRYSAGWRPSSRSACWCTCWFFLLIKGAGASQLDF